MDLEKRTSKAILIKLHILVHHHKGNILTKGHYLFMHFDQIIPLYGLKKSQMWP